MTLYKRDYTKLSKKEQGVWSKLQKAQKQLVLPTKKTSLRDKPKAVRHFSHLFPNNYLDCVELKQTRRLKKLCKRFRDLLRSPRLTERGILKMIREERAYFIIGAILKDNFNFGHHEAYLFPEFSFGLTPDYLLVGRSSNGYEFVFVELEAPTGKITLSKGELGEAFRKGQNQAKDWNTWLAANFPALIDKFCKLTKNGENLPDEFRRFDPSRVHNVIVAGKRENFKPKTYLERRTERKSGRPLLLHYDNLLEYAEAIIGKETY